MSDIPPYEAPRADRAPAALKSFIYLLARNHLTLGELDAAVHAASARTAPLPDDVIAAYADDVARRLVYER